MAGPNHSPAPEGSDRQMARSRISQGRLTPCQRVVGFNSIFQPYEDRNRREKPDEVAAMKLMCAWSECEAVFKDPMPADWRSLLVFWSPYSARDKTLGEIAQWTTCDRDAVLCPVHARMLEGSLKDIARWTRDPVAGTA